ncbi:MAG TPA: pitrilysin family protein [Vicinamibacterales bacterium]|nr:pitrilysin family protein [Vicinamibacterales bacterium]
MTSSRLALRPLLWRGIRLALILALVARAAGAQAPLPAGMEEVTSVEGITEYRLANGLRVLLIPDPSKDTITVNMTYLVGSRHENYGESGMAHLLEHLLFKGTPKHPNIPRELTQHGARANGTTWFDRTNYYETFSATDENLRWALDLEADRMVNSFVAQKDLDSEMTVVRNEFERGENDSSGVLMDRVLSTAYLWHNYGKSTIGARADIENVPIDRLQGFYRLHYQPDNAVLVVAGRIDLRPTLGLIAETFGALPKPARTMPTQYTQEPTQDGERSVTLQRVGDVQYAAVGYHVPAGPDPDYAAIALLGHVLGNAPSGRLYRALVETKKATRTFAFDFQLHDPGYALFGAEVRQESSLDAARDALLQAVDDIGRNPPTSEELERARAALLKQIDLDLNSSNRIGLQLTEWIGMGDWRLLFLHRDRLRSATGADVQRAAARYFKPSNRTVGLFLPTAKPDRSEIAAVPDVASVLKGYKGDPAIATGEAFDPAPANIDARTVRSTLPGGLRLTLLEKRTRGRTVVADLTLRFGDEKSLMNRRVAGDLAADMLMRGTLKRTRQQIQDELDRLKARVRVSGSATSVNAAIETTRENLPAVLRLVNEVLREPSFPAGEFEPLRQQRLANVEEQLSDPTALASVAFQRHLRPRARGDVRYVPTLEESIAELSTISLDDVKKFHADFYGASYGEVSVIGDFDPKEIAAVTGDVFNTWKTPQPFTRVADTFAEAPPIDRALETPDKANAYFVAGLNLNVRDDDPDYPALLLSNYMLGGGFISSRLATRIRQKEGISYSVGSQLQVASLDKVGSFTVRAIYAPENAARLETAFKEEIARALAEGFTEEEIKTAKTGMLQSRQVSRAQDGELASRLGLLQYLGRTITWDADLDRKLEALTAAEIKAALSRHLDPSKISIVKAGDFAKTRAGTAPKP